MDMFMEIVLFFIVYFVWIEAVPPEACFANFRWDDCGQAPVPVIYYWKPGSRCEVGLWRGCLPNLNMFQDEYECVATCIYTARGGAEDFHSLYEIGQAEISYDETTVTTANSDDNCTVTSAENIVTSDNVTIGGENATGTSSGIDQATDSSQTDSSNQVSEGTTNAS